MPNEKDQQERPALVDAVAEKQPPLAELGLVVPPRTLASNHSSSKHDMEKIVQYSRDEAELATDGTSEEEQHRNTVDWDGPDDPNNPMNWPGGRKWTTIVILSAIAFNQAMSSTVFAPGVPDVLQDFHSQDQVHATLLVSIFVIGLAVGPLLLAPLSELYGRLPLIHATNLSFLLSSILCAVSTNMAMLLVFRLTMGMSSLSLGGAFVADMMRAAERSRAINVWNLGPVLAPIVGPIAGGYISLHVSWRWTFWLVAIIAALLSASCMMFLAESYPPRLLELKARRLRRETGNLRLRSRHAGHEYTPWQLIRLSIVRPAKMMVRCPVVSVVSLLLGIAYSYMYVMFTTFPAVFEQTYGFNAGQAGLSYLGLGLGALFAQCTLDVFATRYLARKLAARHPGGEGGEGKPEDQMPLLIAGTVLLAIGLFWYGWAAEYRVHWAVPIMGTAFCGVGITYSFTGALTYLVNAFPLFAASALAANSFVRCVLGTIIPLAGPPLYGALGLGWGNSLLGFVALAVTPACLALWRFGECMRKSPRFQPTL